MAPARIIGAIAAGFTLNAAQKREVTALKRPILSSAKQFGTVREKLGDLAPRVVKLYNSITADAENFTYVEFCRLFDDSIPTHAADRDGTEGYRNHSTYYTMQYMRRLVQNAGRQRTPGQGIRDTAADALARTLATVLQIVPEKEQPKVWEGIQTELGFGERIMTRLRKRVADTQPLFALNVTKPAKIGKVIHMERAAVSAENEPMRQQGQRVELPEGRKARRKPAA